jgi:hypothetical protein
MALFLDDHFVVSIGRAEYGGAAAAAMDRPAGSG